MTISVHSPLDKVAMSAFLDEARAKGLWLRSKYQGFWLSPDELEALQKKGQYRWGCTNWEMCDPQDWIDSLCLSVQRASNDLAEAIKRIRLSRKT